MLFFLAQPLPIVPETFYDWRGRGKDPGCCSALVEKNLPTQGRGNNIGIPKNLYVYHFICFPRLFPSPLEFVNLNPTRLNLKLLVSLKNLALE